MKTPSRSFTSIIGFFSYFFFGGEIMAAPVASLSSSGWVYGPAEKLDKLFASFFVSEYSQSNTFRGSIASLPYLIQLNPSNPDALRTSVESTLISLLKDFFDQISVNVTAEPIENSPSKIDLRVDVIVVQDGYSYSLGKALQIMDSRVVNIMTLNN